MSDFEKTGGNAFPQPCTVDGYAPNSCFGVAGGGMTLLDYFAAKAMQGAIAGYVPTMQTNYWSSGSISKFSYELAEAMIQERKKWTS